MIKKILASAFAAVLFSATVSWAVLSTDRIVPQGTAPALTSCGGGSPAINGTDLAGTVTMGTSATGCVITFAVAYPFAPHCVVTWIASPLASQSYATSTTAITLTQTSTSSNVVKYVCFAATS
jgi:hypothetical protein